MTIKEKVLATFAGKANQVFQSYEIVDSVLQLFPDTNRVSVMPADYCYNRTNKGIKFDFHLFESLDNGMYKCLVWKIPYDGIVKWKKMKLGNGTREMRRKLIIKNPTVNDLRLYVITTPAIVIPGL